MAIGADPGRHRVHSCQGEARVVVIKRGVCPVNCVVARFARRGESSRCVRRVGGPRVVLLVAGIAQSAIQRVVVVDVTIGATARRHCMRVSQREAGCRVVKLAIGPLNRVVAGIASRREPSRSVGYWCGCVVVIRLVAGHASRARQVVIIVDVAISAGPRRHRVISRQRESSAVVIERCIRPGRGVMALIAGLREIRGDVIRIGGALVILEVTGHARRAVQAVVVVDVAIGAGSWRNCVQPCERESSAVVVERCIRPGRGVVALVAGLREVRGDMVRVRRALIVLEVAGHARSAVQAVVIVDVAVGAGARRHGVHSSQHKPRTAVVKG